MAPTGGRKACKDTSSQTDSDDGDDVGDRLFDGAFPIFCLARAWAGEPESNQIIIPEPEPEPD